MNKVFKLIGVYLIAYIFIIMLMFIKENTFTYVLALVINFFIFVYGFKYFKLSSKSIKIFLLIIGALTFILFSDMGYFISGIYQSTPTVMLPLEVLNLLNIILVPLCPIVYIAIKMNAIYLAFAIFPLYLFGIYKVTNIIKKN